MLGVNLSGAEFGGSNDKYGWDYKYPTIKDLTFYVDKGITLFRLPVKWDRLQPELGKELDKAEVSRLLAFLDSAEKVGGKVIVDIHNYGRYEGKAIGSKDLPIETFADFWAKLATTIGDKPAVYGYDLMNEPHGMPTKTAWPDAAQAATDAIRALGDTHTIFIEGESWAGASNWARDNPFLKVNDPLDNLVYEAHLYFDKDGSGTYKGGYDAEKANPDIGEKRLQSFVSWLKANDAKGFIGEFGVPSDDPRWQVALNNFLDVMNENGLSGTYWGAGSWFNGYDVGLLDKDGNAKASLETLLGKVADGNHVGAGSSGLSSPQPKPNAAPEANNDALTIVSGDLGKGNVLANDTEANKDALTAKLKTGPANGTVTIAEDGSYVYRVAEGFSGKDSFTYTASDGKTSSIATVMVTVAPKPNAAPQANNDPLTMVSGELGKGNVLANDTDANKDALTAKIKAGPLHGTVTLNEDGSYVYKAAAGYSGADSFTYTASDGKMASTATVSVTVKAPALINPALPNSDLVQRAGTLDGSDSSSNKLTGIKGHNSFFFDHDAKSGTDQITNFERDDILVLKGILSDGNGDGLISLSKSKLSLGGTDKLTMTGVSALRYLGTDETGLSVYANAAVKPKGAIEGTIGDDSLGGALPATKKAVFFYDTGLDIDLGNDQLGNFNNNDLLVTTTALATTKLHINRAATLSGASGNLGTIDFDAGTVDALEFDGSVTRSGVTYYVYSQEGSSVGLADLAF